MIAKQAAHMQAIPTDEDFRYFRFFARFRRRGLIEYVNCGLFHGILDHGPAKTDERDTCHNCDKGYPSWEQELAASPNTYSKVNGNVLKAGEWVGNRAGLNWYSQRRLRRKMTERTPTKRTRAPRVI